ncbi:MAG TPA: NADP-dependent oxidoreductase [Acidobacteriaceae bacterium]|nr:NADP-dependent oxidoreductase [Acidobacteriaceae bacterium]
MSTNLPKVIKAAVVDAGGPPEAIHLKEVPLPALAPDHVIIALEYAGVGMWDAKQRDGSWGRVKPGTILGADGSGTVAAVGSKVTRFHVGDRVYSYSYGNSGGGFYAEYVSVPSDRVAPVPAHMDMKVAGGMPCIALTALSGLETLKAAPGQTILIFGASGGVGSCAVWLGRAKGATMVGTARPDAQEYVRALGAEHAVDPGSPQREAVIHRVATGGFDAALVTTNGDALPDFLSHLKRHAPVAYPNGVEPKPHSQGHPVSAFDGEMSEDAFTRLNATIGSRQLPLRIQSFPFKDVAAAHHRIEEGHVVGKIVLHIAP